MARNANVPFLAMGRGPSPNRPVAPFRGALPR
jgi:hypothetical protein